MNDKNINGIKGKYLIFLKEKIFKIMVKIFLMINVNIIIKKKKFNGNISFNILKSNMFLYFINLDVNR